MEEQRCLTRPAGSRGSTCRAFRGRMTRMRKIGILAIATLITGSLSLVLHNPYLAVVALAAFLGLALWATER